MGVINLVKKVAGKAGDGVAKVAALSPEQLLEIEKQRVDYLSEMPDPKDAAAEELTGRLLAASSVEIYNAYLPQISSIYAPIEKTAEYDGPFDDKYNIRYLNITKWVTDKKENSLEKLVNVYEVLSNEDCNIALIFNRMIDKTDVYLAVTNTKNSNNNKDSDSYFNRLRDAIRGNFPGSEWKDEKGKGILPCLDNDTKYSVASATNIPTEKSEKFISQTIEKLLDGIVPEDLSDEYIIILLATPVQDIEDRKLLLGELYSGLAPYAGWQTSYTFHEMNNVGSSATVGVNVGASAGVQNGQNSSQSKSDGVTDSESNGVTESSGESESYNESHSDNESFNESDSNSKNIQTSIGMSASAGGSAGVPFVAEGHVDVGINASVSTGASSSHTSGRMKGITDTINKGRTLTKNKAISKQLGRAVNHTASTTSGIFKSMNFGGNFGLNFARSSTVSASVGKDEGIHQSFTNYNIKHTLEVLEEQMKRLEESSALGMWDFAAYVLGENQDVVNNVAHSYIALTQGEKSHMSKASINVWRGDMGLESRYAKEICDYLREFRHPMFGLNPSLLESDFGKTFLIYPSIVTATTSLTGKELAYSLNFPQKSIAGLPVIECAEFGRNVTKYESTQEEKGSLFLGDVFHMNHKENMSVKLDVNSLSSHTFITGSTGSGKSNTVYQILNQAREKDIKFLVVEPAKGEYKYAFGNDEDVNVFGTNLKLTPLLKLNPFSFPDTIHVLEHIDRLVEIFNVCWPMYAAMPAVLKNAIEVSYEDCGWDLTDSTNEYSDDYYPTFKDVARNIKTIIDSSEYNSENKGAYKGSLLTRLQSLTNGIYGMIFTKDEITNERLFNENTIVDLSRVGSTETKALIMGLLVLKLQEHRMDEFQGTNQNIKHITVLEEAHNLLKRTSTEVSSESSNLLGKSVEMIANAIAEMRTYGEGFIIADQAPGLLDMATIRNTNTKIIMRLPDLMDRELVGKAANLNEEQITELAKLPRGVAAVYQNEWIQPVLCQVEKASVNESKYNYYSNDISVPNVCYDDRLKIATMLSGIPENECAINDVKDILVKLDVEDSIKIAILKWLKNPPKEPRMTKMAPIMGALFEEIDETVKKSYKDSMDPEEWTVSADTILKKIYGHSINDQVRRDIIQSIITNQVYLEANDIASLEKWSKMFKL